MNHEHDEELARFLRDHLPSADLALPRDLWPQMLARLDHRAPAGWLDWATAALVPLWLALFPEVLPGLLFHL
jgi:hypothetical protein